VRVNSEMVGNVIANTVVLFLKLLLWSISMFLIWLRPIVQQIFGCICSVSLFIIFWKLVIGWFNGNFYREIVWPFFGMSFGAFIILWLYDSLILWISIDDIILF